MDAATEKHVPEEKLKNIKRQQHDVIRAEAELAMMRAGLQLSIVEALLEQEVNPHDHEIDEVTGVVRKRKS